MIAELPSISWLYKVYTPDTDRTTVGACGVDDKQADVDICGRRVGWLVESPRPEDGIPELRRTDFEGVVERYDN